jgi:hypothetical protein
MFNYRGSPLQDKVEQWSKVAYDTLPSRQPDYEMDNGKHRPVSQGISRVSTMLEQKFMQGHQQSNILYISFICFKNTNFVRTNYNTH